MKCENILEANNNVNVWYIPCSVQERLEREHSHRNCTHTERKAALGPVSSPSRWECPELKIKQNCKSQHRDWRGKYSIH